MVVKIRYSHYFMRKENLTFEDGERGLEDGVGRRC